MGHPDRCCGESGNQGQATWPRSVAPTTPPDNCTPGGEPGSTDHSAARMPPAGPLQSPLAAGAHRHPRRAATGLRVQPRARTGPRRRWRASSCLTNARHSDGGRPARCSNANPCAGRPRASPRPGLGCRRWRHRRSPRAQSASPSVPQRRWPGDSPRCCRVRCRPARGSAASCNPRAVRASHSPAAAAHAPAAAQGPTTTAANRHCWRWPARGSVA